MRHRNITSLVPCPGLDERFGAACARWARRLPARRARAFWSYRSHVADSNIHIFRGSIPTISPPDEGEALRPIGLRYRCRPLSGSVRRSGTACSNAGYLHKSPHDAEIALIAAASAGARSAQHAQSAAFWRMRLPYPGRDNSGLSRSDRHVVDMALAQSRHWCIRTNSAFSPESPSAKPPPT